MLLPPLLGRDCPTRALLAEVADKWSMLVLTEMHPRPRRFNEIKRSLDGISQKSLTQTLRRLERNGLVIRTVIASTPVAVQYSLTALGESLWLPFSQLCDWTKQHYSEVEQARSNFDLSH